MIVSVSQAGNGAPKRIDLERTEIVLGKHPDCDVVLADPKVSRRHARIVSRDGALFVGDLGSTNGTKLNGELLSGEAALRSGDVIEIAAFRIQIEEPQAVRPPSSSRPPSDSTATSMQGGKVAAPKPAAEAAPAAPKPKAAEEGEEAKKAKMFWASMESFFQPIWEYIAGVVTENADLLPGVDVGAFPGQLDQHVPLLVAHLLAGERHLPSD